MTTHPRTRGVLIFIPTYNDREYLPDLVRDVLRERPSDSVLVIDDGSIVPFDFSLLPNGCLGVRLPDNCGLGICTHVAFDHAIRHEYDCVVRIDADGQHPVNKISALVEAVQDEGAAIVVGVRSNQAEGAGTRAFLARIMKAYLSFVSGLITGGGAPLDVNTGFIAFNREALILLNRFSLDPYPEPQIFVLACRNGLKITEVAIEQVARKFGTSTLSSLRALQMLYRFNMFVFDQLIQARERP